MCAREQELSILGYNLLCFLPSTIAASSVLLALAWEEDVAGAGQLAGVSGYSAPALRGCLGALLPLHHAGFRACDLSDPFLPIRDKYRDPALHRIAHALPLPRLPPWLFQGLQ